jgi:hypothetical protein
MLCPRATPSARMPGRSTTVAPRTHRAVVPECLPRSIADPCPSGLGCAAVVVAASECAQTIVVKFLDRPEGGHDTGCLDQVTIPEFSASSSPAWLSWRVVGPRDLSSRDRRCAQRDAGSQLRSDQDHRPGRAFDGRSEARSTTPAPRDLAAAWTWQRLCRPRRPPADVRAGRAP